MEMPGSLQCVLNLNLQSGSYFFYYYFILFFFFLELGVLQDKLKRCRHSPRSCLEKLTVWYLFKKKKIKCIWDITGTFR